MQNAPEITLKPTTAKPKRKHTHRKPRHSRAKAEDFSFLQMATVVNSAMIALLFILLFLKLV